jgi:hypothetical protein
MPKPKNLGPCIIPGCDKPAPYRKLQIGTMDKIRKKDLKNEYYFLEEGNQLCCSHYMKIVEPDRHDKDKMKRKSSESLDVDYSKNPRTKSNDSYDESSSNQTDDTSDNLLINIVDNQLDWSKIKINLTGSNITMSKENFLSIVEHINKIELQLDNNLYCEEDNEEPSFDAMNNEIDGNYFLLY